MNKYFRIGNLLEAVQTKYYIIYGGFIMDYKDLNAFEIVERSIMQCKEENESILTHESVDFFMQSGLNDDM